MAYVICLAYTSRKVRYGSMKKKQHGAASLFLAFSLCLLLICGASAPAAAATDEWGVASRRLVEQGVLQGDANGSLNLESSLTRAELAVILCRMNGDELKVKDDPASYAPDCRFSDVPEWAKPYVGYCVGKGLMVGYDSLRFGADDAVSPQTGCTVALRYLGYSETDWDYNTACAKAVSVGLAPDNGLNGTQIKRGDMAVIIYRALSVRPVDKKAEYKYGEAREDFSQQANSAIFGDLFTRDFYNALRQTIVDRDTILAGSSLPGFNPSYNYAAFDSTKEGMGYEIYLLANRINGYYDYARTSPTGSKYWTNTIFTVRVPLGYAKVDSATEEIIKQAASLTDREKVRLFNDYICENIYYDKEFDPDIPEFFAGPGAVRGRCSTYARAFKYLCDRAGIVCIIHTGENHAWNSVYVDGKWSYVDVTWNDVSYISVQGSAPLVVGGVTIYPGETVTKDMIGNEVWRMIVGEPRYLLIDSYELKDEWPNNIMFARELLIPGSTK